MSQITYLSDLPHRLTPEEARADAKARETKQHQQAIQQWLIDNPEVGALNGGKYYIVNNGQIVNVAPLSKLN